MGKLKKPCGQLAGDEVEGVREVQHREEPEVEEVEQQLDHHLETTSTMTETITMTMTTTMMGRLGEVPEVGLEGLPAEEAQLPVREEEASRPPLEQQVQAGGNGNKRMVSWIDSNL